ncbi:MAG TPA: hypothetical protein VN032_07365 [Thermoanaerobaculia bacterium]|nr:hypothetical protein [Thermoanaerobaculia bacterium]
MKIEEAAPMMTEDFTKLPFGSLVSRSRSIIRCPNCRRHGVLESLPDGTRGCIHVEVSTIHTAGTVVQSADRCELAGPRSVLPAGMLETRA